MTRAEWITGVLAFLAGVAIVLAVIVKWGGTP